MKIKNIFPVLLLCILPSLAFAGTSYYVDCSQSDPSEDGSYSHPWNSVADVNLHRFSTGDDVYFKVNTTCIPSERLSIDWDGSSSDQAIIGAYYGDGQFGLNGNARPIIDGDSTLPGDESGLIRYRDGTGHVTIKDLFVKNCAGYGIEISYAYTPEHYHTDYNRVENCYVQNTTEQGIIIARGSYNVVENNIVEKSSLYVNNLAGIEITGMSMEDVTLHNEVRGNEVYWCAEGIGVYKGARYTTVEKNVGYDNKKYHIYVANARDNTVRYNLVYEGPGDLDGAADYMVGADCEGHELNVVKVTGNNEFYGNLIAGGGKGLFIENNCYLYSETCVECPIEQSGNRVYNNTLVDNVRNFSFAHADELWSDNLIKNNISWTITDGSVHSNNYSPTGVTWSHNNFDESVSGKAANNARIYKPELKKTSGWRFLTGGMVNGTEFSLTASSKNIGNEIPIDGYNDRIFYSDYASDDAIKVQTKATSPSDIGAWTYGTQEGYINLNSPSGLRIMDTK